MRRRDRHHIPGAPRCQKRRFLPCDPMRYPRRGQIQSAFSVPFSPWRRSLQAETGGCAAHSATVSAGRSVRRILMQDGKPRLVVAGPWERDSRPDRLMLVDIGQKAQSTTRLHPRRKRDPCRAPVNGHVAKSDDRVLAMAESTSSSASSHLLRSWRASSGMCARRHFCILDPVLGQIQAPSSKVTVGPGTHGREDGHLAIATDTQRPPHTGHTG